jgi:hypothetical protein
MKKILLASLLLGFAAFSVFAQLNLSGKAYVGVQVTVPYEEDEKGDKVKDNEKWTVEHREEGAPKFDFAATASKDNYGAKLDTTFSTATPFTLNGVYGWVSFFDGTYGDWLPNKWLPDTKLTVGKLSDAAWVTGEKEWSLDKDVAGFRIELSNFDKYSSSLSGLRIGAVFDVAGGSQDAYDSDTERLFKQTILGVSYINPLFNLLASYDIGDNGQLLAGFNFTGIDRLTTATIEAKASNLHPDVWEKMGQLSLVEKIVCRTIQRVSASLQADQVLSGNSDAKPFLSFTPGLQYRITKESTFFLEAAFESADEFDHTDFELKPYIELALAGPAVFYVEYALKLSEFKNDSHRLGFGLEVKAF